MINRRSPVLIFGADGQLGRALKLVARRRKLPMVAFSRAQADVTDLAALLRACADLSPCLVINAAAFTEVDGAEVRPLAAYAVNARGAENVAILASEWGVPMLHVSTDYVFDGRKKTPYLEGEAVNPLGVYGASKLSGERRVLEVHDRALVLRTSCVYGLTGRNFFKSILAAAEAGRALKVVDDQIGCPTRDVDLAKSLLEIAEHLVDRQSAPAHRILHLCGAEAASRYEWACAIVDEANADLQVRVPVTPVGTVSAPGLATRPTNSALSVGLARSVFNVEIPGWRTALPAVVRCYFSKNVMTENTMRKAIA